MRGSRHFWVRLGVTLGVLGSTAVAVFWPDHQHHGLAVGVATNLLWIWGE